MTFKCYGLDGGKHGSLLDKMLVTSKCSTTSDLSTSAGKAGGGTHWWKETWSLMPSLHVQRDAKKA